MRKGLHSKISDFWGGGVILLLIAAVIPLFFLSRVL